jgi:hypothetical protein
MAHERVFSMLEWLSPAACAVSMAVLLGAAILCRAQIAELARVLTRRQWAALAGVLSAALAVRLAVVPATERLYYDEHTYLQLARGIAEEGRARVAAVGVIDARGYHCESGSFPHWPSGWPTLLALFLRLGNYSRWIGPALNLGLSLSAVVLVALLAAALVPGRPVWLAAAAIYACFPANQIWSRTSASEVFAAFGAALAVLAAVRYAQKPDPRLGVFLAASLALAAQVRNELVLLLPVCAVFVGWVGGWRALRASAWPFALALVLLLPQALEIGALARAYDPNFTEGSGFGLRYFPANVTSVAQYLRSDWMVLLCLILALMGASRVRVVWIWAVCAALPPMFYFGGSYGIPGGERFALGWLPPLAVAAGAGVYTVHCSLSDFIGRRGLIAGWLVVFLGALLWTAPRVAAEDRQTEIPRADCAFLRAALRLVPEGGMVISADPPVVIAEGRSAAFLPWVGRDPGGLEELAARYRDRLYYFTAPSSAPAQWREGPESERRIFSFFQPEVVARETAPGGARVLYRLRSTE